MESSPRRVTTSAVTETFEAPYRALPLPSYIRFYAATAGISEASRLALEHAKSLLRIAPVRVIPADGAGIWPGYESLLTTPATGSFVNVVSCAPEAWCRTHRIPMAHKADPFVGRVSSSWSVEQTTRPADVREIPRPAPEVLVEHVDYWTCGVRNVLFAASPPKDQFQLAAARKFAVVIVPTNHGRYYWVNTHKVPASQVTLVEVPLSDAAHAVVRAAVLDLEAPTTEARP